MDGFFVAKFKVEKRTKAAPTGVASVNGNGSGKSKSTFKSLKQSIEEDDEGEGANGDIEMDDEGVDAEVVASKGKATPTAAPTAMKLNGQGKLVRDKSVRVDSAFDDEADEEIIKREFWLFCLVWRTFFFL